jgi:hypothetical protein
MPRTSTPKPFSPAAPAPDPEDTSPPDPTEAGPAAPDGREANGRFAKGNRGGPGNPFARQTAALRKQLLEAVTKQDMQDLCTMLILRAIVVRPIRPIIVGLPIELTRGTPTRISRQA